MRPVTCFLVCWIVAFAPCGASEDKVVLVDFETAADKVFEQQPNVFIVKENAKSGAHALKVAHPPGGESYEGIAIADPARLKLIREHFKEFPLLCLDIFNPNAFPVSYGASASDAKSTSYGTRYNNEGFYAPPGWSTFRLNLTGLTRSSSNTFSEREPLDITTLKGLSICTFDHQHPKAVMVFFDALRLEGTGLPKVDGLLAFDFGPSKSAVFPGFQGVHENTLYASALGFGWKNPLGSWHRRAGPPDDLGGDYGCGDAFLIELKSGPGAYVVQMCIDRFDDWGQPFRFTRRTVTLNGKTVHDEKLNGETFLKTRYLRYEQDEDTPHMDIWESRVKPLLPVHAFEAAVGADGKLDVRVAAEGGTPGIISFLVVYPKSKESEGKAYLTALELRRKQMYADIYPFTPPMPDHEKPKPSAEEQARGYVTFTRSTQADIVCQSAPTAQERGAPLVLSVCPGQREAAQIGIVPLKKIEGARVTATDLAGPGNARIPASAIELRKIRNLLRKRGYSTQFTLEPCLLQGFEALTFEPAVTRGLWLTLKVPAEAVPGEYAGKVKIEAEGKAQEIPLKLTVYPFTLEKADDISLSGMNTTPGFWNNWYADLNEPWWTAADAALRDLADHRFNAVTGGPSMAFKCLKEGKADIDFADADRWMALAVKHGLTMPGDSYQGMDVGLPRSSGKDCMAANEQYARSQYGIGYGELIKLAYGAVEVHA